MAWYFFKKSALKSKMNNINIASNQEFFVIGKDNIKLRVHRTILTNAKGTIVIVHGVGEYLGRYQYLRQSILAQGYNCYLYDHRGHGLSEGIRGDVVSFHDYAEDLAIIYNTVLSETPHQPIYVFGHSMGSLVVLLNLILHPGKWQGAIVSGVPLKIVRANPKWQRLLANIVVKIFPLIPIPSDIDPAYLSHDETVIEAYKTDKLVQHRVTVRWGIAFLAAVREIKARLSQITENLLILHGEDDCVSHVDGGRLLAETIGDQQAKFIIYPGLFHELHNEPESDRNKEFIDIQAWLTKQSPTPFSQGVGH